MPELSDGIQPIVPESVGAQSPGTELVFAAVHRDAFPNTRSLTSQGLAVAMFGSTAGIRAASECASWMGGNCPERIVVLALAAIRSTPLSLARVVALVSTPADRASKRTTSPTASPIPSDVIAERPGRRRRASSA